MNTRVSALNQKCAYGRFDGMSAGDRPEMPKPLRLNYINEQVLRDSATFQDRSPNIGVFVQHQLSDGFRQSALCICKLPTQLDKRLRVPAIRQSHEHIIEKLSFARREIVGPGYEQICHPMQNLSPSPG